VMWLVVSLLTSHVAALISRAKVLHGVRQNTRAKEVTFPLIRASGENSELSLVLKVHNLVRKYFRERVRLL
jgi:hypothetical protein